MEKKNQVHLGCYIQRCARVDQVGTGDGTIADRYLSILMTSLGCWHDGIQSDASGRPRWPTGMSVVEPAPSPTLAVCREGLRGGWSLVVAPNASCSHGKWRPRIIVL